MKECLIFMKINHFPCDQGITFCSFHPLPSLCGLIFKVEKLIFPDPMRTTSIIAINMKSKLNSFIIFDTGPLSEAKNTNKSDNERQKELKDN